MADEITEDSFKHYGEWSPEEQYIRLYCPQEMRVPIGRVYDENRALTAERDTLAAENERLREALEEIASDNTSWHACRGVPWCTPGRSHHETCAVDIAEWAITDTAEPAPRAADLLAVVAAAREWKRMHTGLHPQGGQTMILMREADQNLKDALARLDGDADSTP